VHESGTNRAHRLRQYLARRRKGKTYTTKSADIADAVTETASHRVLPLGTNVYSTDSTCFLSRNLSLLSPFTRISQKVSSPPFFRWTERSTDNVSTRIYLDISPLLFRSDFDVFGKMKKHLRGRRFPSDDTVKAEVQKWLRNYEFYATAWKISSYVITVPEQVWKVCGKIND
jgi:hypothetical protein